MDVFGAMMDSLILTSLRRAPQASASEDGYVRLWSISQQKKIHEQAIVPEARGGSDPCVWL